MQISSRKASLRAVSACGSRSSVGASFTRIKWPGISSTGAMMSTAPVAIAPAGISPYCGAVPLLPWASVRPPHSLMALSPRAPSLPVPDSTMPTARSRSTEPKESKNASMGRSNRSLCSGGSSTFRHPSLSVTSECGGGTYTTFGRISTRSDDLDHGHGGPARQDVGEHALASRGQMQDHHERHAAIGTHVIEKAMECLDASGGRTDSDDRKLGSTHDAGRRTWAAAIFFPCASGTLLKHDRCFACIGQMPRRCGGRSGFDLQAAAACCPSARCRPRPRMLGRASAVRRLPRPGPRQYPPRDAA